MGLLLRVFGRVAFWLPVVIPNLTKRCRSYLTTRTYQVPYASSKLIPDCDQMPPLHAELGMAQHTVRFT